MILGVMSAYYLVCQGFGGDADTWDFCHLSPRERERNEGE